MADGNPYMGVMSGQIRKDDQEIINLADIYGAAQARMGIALEWYEHG